MRQECGKLLNRTRHIKRAMTSEAVEQGRGRAERGDSPRPPRTGGTQGCDVESPPRREVCGDSLWRLDVELDREERLTFAVEKDGDYLSPV